MSTKNSLMAVATMMSTAGFSASAYAGGDKDEECARLIARGEIPLATL